MAFASFDSSRSSAPIQVPPRRIVRCTRGPPDREDPSARASTQAVTAPPRAGRNRLSAGFDRLAPC